MFNSQRIHHLFTYYCAKDSHGTPYVPQNGSLDKFKIVIKLGRAVGMVSPLLRAKTRSGVRGPSVVPAARPSNKPRPSF